MLPCEHKEISINGTGSSIVRRTWNVVAQKWKITTGSLAASLPLFSGCINFMFVNSHSIDFQVCMNCKYFATD